MEGSWEEGGAVGREGAREGCWAGEGRRERRRGGRRAGETAGGDGPVRVEPGGGRPVGNSQQVALKKQKVAGGSGSRQRAEGGEERLGGGVKGREQGEGDGSPVDWVGHPGGGSAGSETGKGVEMAARGGFEAQEVAGMSGGELEGDDGPRGFEFAAGADDLDGEPAARGDQGAVKPLQSVGDGAVALFDPGAAHGGGGVAVIGRSLVAVAVAGEAAVGGGDLGRSGFARLARVEPAESDPLAHNLTGAFGCEASGGSAWRFRHGAMRTL